MLSSTSAPPPPPASTKPRPRAHTMLSPAPDRSPTFTRSYHQPMGSGSQRRTNSHQGHARSRSQGDARSAGRPAAIGKGKRRAVFCDVVLDKLELDEDGRCVYPTGPAAAFLDSLGTPVQLPEEGSSAPPAVRPMTPGKTPKVDFDKVRQNLHELWVTEESYHRKMSSLLKDFALPLRAFSKKRETSIIPAFEANHLFINIEQLVPVSEALERDLRQLVGQMQRDKGRIPDGFGEVILRHVEQMQPYKKWLGSVAASEAIRQNLDKSNSSFREFVERTQVHSRESAQTTGGFKEFLAEPFQRISRYRLMIDPIIFHLPPDDPSVEPLQIAAGFLTDICSMQVDDATKRAAVFWSLKETIDGFPDAMVGFDRRFIGCIDADEIIEIADSRPTTLRCTLFLFNDTLLIAKRPSGDKPGKVHAGLDDLDRLVGLYQTSHLSSSQANLLGSPKKLRKGVLGFRGLVPLSEAVAVDLGSESPSGPEFGLMFDHPPLDQSERWCGRPARKFVVASTYPQDVRQPEKEVWLGKVAETVLQAKLKGGAKRAVEGKMAWDESCAPDSTEVHWAVWDRRTWESCGVGQRGKLALYLTGDHQAPGWGAVRDGRPVVSARATLLPPDQCRFEVQSSGSSEDNVELIRIDRIAGAVAELGMSYGLFSFPTLRPLPLAERPSRPRSNLLGAALDIFSGGTSLKRQHSINSRGSSVATTTINTPNLSGSGSASPAFGTPLSPPTALSPRMHPTNSLSQSTRVPLTKKSAPDLCASVSRHSSAASPASYSRTGGMDNDDGDPSKDVVASMGAAPERNRRAAGRRSLSLPPPPQGRFGSPTPSPSRGGQDYSSYKDAAYEAPEPSPMMDAAEEPAWPVQPPQSPQAPTTSPMGYRPQVGSTRRRMIGPRDMRPPSATAETPVGLSSPAHLPFARSQSPTPQRRPHSSDTSTLTYASSPVHSESAELAEPEDNGSLTGSSAKRSRPPVEMSPRPTPAKKVASIGGPGAAPRHPSSLSGQPLFPRQPSDALSENRIPSSSSIGRIHIRNRRVTSGATIRGPPSPPKPAEEPDVFHALGSPVKAERRPAPSPEPTFEDVQMDEADNLPPFERLRKHVDYLRLKLAREVANKENGRVASPTALSRSPHTRNVFAKTLGDPAFSSPGRPFHNPSVFTTFSEPRARPDTSIDLSVLSRWTRKLGELVEACEVLIDAKPPSPESDHGSALEVAMLEQERDLLAADLAAVKDEVANLVEQEMQARRELTASKDEGGKLRQAYHEICQEAETLLADFNTALEELMQAAQAEPGATGVYVELTSQLHEAVTARYQAENELRNYRRAMQGELEEKTRWGELLRQHGLLPA
ncbi:hypothetical protein JCM11641_000137 [Rhodosporidiobolus odoratus]